ncbi:Hpt domain-containing protein [Stieleria sp. JC731]|uniref:ATP-binding protein n=1 Tax=Pirellulaceae TaxID=2691357 RepID=UPI001E55FAD0|nr:ATP-binding protein [Stieleria sp. JC731]MCC9603267.1 Hpt domain-containing protein [Stieleria sp. JC731]
MEQDSELARLARQTFFYANVAFFAGLLYALMYICLGMYFTAAGASIGFFGGGTALVMLRRNARWSLAAHLTVFSSFSAVAVVILGTGNLHSPVMGWLFAAPMMAVSTLGRRAGLAWVAIVLSFVTVLYFPHQLKLIPDSEVPRSFEDAFVSIVQGGLVLAIFFTVWSFEVVQKESAARLRDAKVVAEDALQEAEQTHKDALLVINNIAEGLAMLTLDGKFASPPSSRFQSWFGLPAKGQFIWDYLSESNAVAGELMELNWEQLQCDWMPLELGLQQLPQRMEHQGSVFKLSYQPVFENSKQLAQLLLICTDITAELEAEHANDLQQEQMAIFARFVRDPRSVRGFLSESERLVKLIEHGRGTIADQKRWIHTLKGNFGIFGLRSFSQWLHHLEDELAEQRDVCDEVQREAIGAQWQSIRDRLAMIIPDETSDQVTIDKARIESTIEEAARGASVNEIVGMIQRWTWDSVSQRFDLLSERAKRLAERLDKPGLCVEIDSTEIRTPPTETWNAFWNSLTHVVRNAVDHGVETTERRVDAKKKSTGTIKLSAYQSRDSFAVEIADDGAGIDWNQVTKRAAKLGIRLEEGETPQELLFADGLSTKDKITETSGRGVGMSACKEACLALDGKIEVESVLGKGTTIRFVFPAIESEVLEPAYMI